MANTSALNTVPLNASPTTEEDVGEVVVGATLNGGALNSFGLNGGSTQTSTGTSEQRLYAIGTHVLTFGQATAGWTQFCDAAPTQVTTFPIPRLQQPYDAAGFKSYQAGTPITPMRSAGFVATKFSPAYWPKPRLVAALGASHTKWPHYSAYGVVLGPPSPTVVRAEPSLLPTWGEPTMAGSCRGDAQGTITTQYADASAVFVYTTVGLPVLTSGAGKLVEYCRAEGHPTTEVPQPKALLVARASGRKFTHLGVPSIQKDVYEALPEYTICWGCVKVRMRNAGSTYSVTSWQSYRTAHATQAPRVTSLPFRAHRSGRALMRRS